jgi:hypothetical protein
MILIFFKYLVISLTFLHFVSGFTQNTTFHEINKFKAIEAHQGIAVDQNYFYAIGTRTIGKYSKHSGKLIKRWEATEKYPIIHLDSGVIFGNKLYCGHSNYPNLPMTSSVEIWDKETLEHQNSISFGISEGSCTWVDRFNNAWWVCFAHYNKTGGYPNKDNRWTVLNTYNDIWQKIESWTFPEDLLHRFGEYSCSGGSWGPDNRLYVSGHNLPELYALQLPKAGSILELVTIYPIHNRGQGIAWDRTENNIIYSIHRANKEVIVNQLK